ncbi:DUF2804 family protein [Microbacterium protaetiae]|uniref:DUF2804 family protein n=1 Tax=Microbacterium protaetiae TaxID=2509458 RepID=A0A4P6EGN6_9MICO|nr:DUF2804 family protein [Microbacterium protaetiae]QAY60329.1 DUF2804 family protein [Microbacterium protaetiae]
MNDALRAAAAESGGHPSHEQLEWDYDPADWMKPWRIHGGGLEASFTPFYDKRSRTNLLVLASRTDQCFGTWAGTFTTDAGEQIVFDGIEGWAEDVHNRW